MTTLPDALSTQRRVGLRDIDDDVLLAGAKAVTFGLVIVALWSFTHVYKGLTGDAELYAMQALARVRPNLAGDLYLQNVSQDHFTIFSPLYAWFIQWLGLRAAALTLSLVSSAGFVVASWVLARQLSSTATAVLAVAALIIIKGVYGSYEVFGYFENWLTARSVAETLVVTAIACHFLGRKRWALFIAAGALSIHPIMALPGLLLLLCLQLPLRAALLGAALGVLAVLGAAILASAHPHATGVFAVMDPDWLDVVKERSQFLFLQYWTRDDWEINARPFLYLAAYACIVDGQCRKLCLAAMIVGAAGLAVAAIGGLIGPVALLLQGQAWRWVWITSFTSVLLLAPVVMRMWSDEKCGPLCAMLLVLGWIFPVLGRDVCAALALVIWLSRSRLSGSSARALRWAAVALALVVLAWTVANSWTVATSPSPETGRDPLAVSRLRDILGLGPSAVMIVALLYYAIERTRSKWVLIVISTVLAAGTAAALPGSLKSERDIALGNGSEFADWRSLIPPSAVVFVAPAYNSAVFAWFTLERPSYLSVDQSAGVVFSRATAMEVKRRSDVLMPVMDPDWRILARNQQAGSGAKGDKPAARPLTAQGLIRICTDPIMDFVVAREDVGFDAVRHDQAGPWKGWNLYACRRVRSAAASE